MITITKDKIYFSNFSLKRTKSDSKKIKELEPGDISTYLGEDIELGEDVTFERIFDLIILHKKMFNSVFHQDMDGLKIDDFIEDYESDLKNESNFQKYILRVCWSGILYDMGDSIQMYDYPSLEAFGVIDSRIDKNEYPISISLTPLSQIRNKKIILNHSFSIRLPKFEENEYVYVKHRPFRLYDLIGAILRDISHYGGPKDRDEARKDMEIQDKEIENWMEQSMDSNFISEEFSDIIEEEVAKENESTFWDFLYPNSKAKEEELEESEEELRNRIEKLEEELEESVKSDNYERAAEIKKILDQIKK